MTTTTDAENQGEVVIAVMGATGSGKTTFINLVSGSTLRIGKGLESCTSEVHAAKLFELDGRFVRLMDTPGFDDTSKSDTDILKLIVAFLTTAYQAGSKLAGVIYIHRISDIRMGGISTRNFKMFRQLCGADALQNVVIMTNMWGSVSQEVGESREQELATKEHFFKPVLDKNAKLLRHYNTLESAHAVLRHLIHNRPMALRIQQEIVDERKDLNDTDAGMEVGRELREQEKRHRQEMKSVREEMEAAMKARDEETRKEMAAEYQKLQAEMSKVQRESDKLKLDFNAEMTKAQDMMQALRRDAERSAAEQEREMQALRDRLADQANAATERAEIMKQLIELQSRPPVIVQKGGCVVQ